MSNATPHATEPDSILLYRNIFVALLVLTVVTVAVAFINMGVMNDVVALGIATVKATLVLLYFMHVRHSGPLTRIAILSGIVFFLILVGFILSDTLTRAMLGTVRPL